MIVAKVVSCILNELSLWCLKVFTVCQTTLDSLRINKKALPAQSLVVVHPTGSPWTTIEDDALYKLSNFYQSLQHFIRSTNLDFLQSVFQVDSLEHQCVDTHDIIVADAVGASLIYGEITYQGVYQLISAAFSTYDYPKDTLSFVDLGMGTGKCVLQVFLEFPNVDSVFGIELSLQRFRIATAALWKVLLFQSERFKLRNFVTDKQMILVEVSSNRMLEIQCGNLLTNVPISVLSNADLVLVQTVIPMPSWRKLANVFQKGIKSRPCTIAAFHDLSKIFERNQNPESFIAPCGKFRIQTSWDWKGHELNFYKVISNSREAWKKMDLLTAK